MKLEVQKYLETHSTEELTEEFGIIVNDRYQDRMVLNYSMINTPAGMKHHPIVEECRGLILKKGNFKVLCRSFDRFYNYGEDPNSKEYPISESICTEKIDGSLFNVYHDGGRWCVATRKMAFAEGETFRGNTFKSVFERGLGQTVESFFWGRSLENTYICEGVSPENRVVTPYPDYKVFLLAIRNKYSGKYKQEVLGGFVERNFIYLKRPKQFGFSQIEEVLKASKELPAMEEGYVCCTPDGWRIKIKNPAYLAIAHIRGDKLTPKRIAVLVYKQDHEEYLGYFPEDREYFEPYIKAYQEMMAAIAETYDSNKDKEVQKDFALAIKDFPAKPVLFAMRKGRTVGEFFDRFPDDSKVSLIEQFM